MSFRHCIAIFMIVCMFFVQSMAQPADSFDGLFFVGFNLQKDIFKGEKGLLVRKAVLSAVDRVKISTELAEDEHTPTGIIPYGMEGYTESAVSPVDLVKAKQLIQTAGYKMTDQRIKEIRLLHTNGVLTKKIAQELKDNVKHIGIKLVLEGINYADEGKWEATLRKGNYDLFLLALKADDSDKIETFLTSLFHSKKAEANFMNFQDPIVDKALDSLASEKNKAKRKALLKTISSAVDKQIPIISLYNIERIQ